MKIAVVGLWHLGLVTASVMADAGHDVLAFDAADIIEPIRRDEFPVAEPGLPELWKAQRAAGRLRESALLRDVAACDFIWITYDTPLDAEGRAITSFVRDRVHAVVDALEGPATIAISSQMPVGFVASLEAYAMANGRPAVGFVSIPENLRLGSAIAYLRAPDRFVVGTRRATDRERTAAALEPLGAPIVWMGVESAEMTKHALNAFLATSVVFANEIASIAERVGADAREVEEGLKTDVRIGRKAYVRAGEAFAGGTLARDVGFLVAIGREHGVPPLQISATGESNELHKRWLDRSIERVLRGATAPRVAILGLTYKPGTDTLRASSAVALAHRLAATGAHVVAYDPTVTGDPPEIGGAAACVTSVAAALHDADAAVVMTPWPEFREIAPEAWQTMRHRRLIDAQRFLEATAAPLLDEYVAFGRGLSHA